MALFERVIGRHHDIPVTECNQIAAATAGTGTDFEHALFVVPNLAQNAASGTTGSIPPNSLNLRSVSFVYEAAITGAATNNFTLNILQLRNGAILVNTTSSTTITAGSGVVVTPASMANIQVGSQLFFSGGTGTAETVTVTAITSTTFTATFANNHSGAYTITSAPLATITYGNGTNETAFVPHQFSVLMNNTNALLAGDVVAVQRVSAGTGLASPAFTVTLDFVPAGIRA